MDWDNTVWLQHDWIWELGAWTLGLALFGAVIWFIDGYRKYGYWRKNKNEEEDK